MLVRRYKLPIIKWVSSRVLMYSLMVIVNNIVVYTWKLLRESNLNVLIVTTKKWYLCDVKDVLTNLMLVITSQYTPVSSHHIVYLKLNTVLYVNYISTQLGKKMSHLRMKLIQPRNKSRKTIQENKIVVQVPIGTTELC